MYEKTWDRFLQDSTKYAKKVRNYGDISENFIRDSQLAEGKFYPINKLKTGMYLDANSYKTERVILNQKNEIYLHKQ